MSWHDEGLEIGSAIVPALYVAKGAAKVRGNSCLSKFQFTLAYFNFEPKEILLSLQPV